MREAEKGMIDIDESINNKKEMIHADVLMEGDIFIVYLTADRHKKKDKVNR